MDILKVIAVILMAISILSNILKDDSASKGELIFLKLVLIYYIIEA